MRCCMTDNFLRFLFLGINSKAAFELRLSLGSSQIFLGAMEIPGAGGGVCVRQRQLLPALQ